MTSARHHNHCKKGSAHSTHACTEDSPHYHHRHHHHHRHCPRCSAWKLCVTITAHMFTNTQPCTPTTRHAQHTPCTHACWTNVVPWSTSTHMLPVTTTLQTPRDTKANWHSLCLGTIPEYHIQHVYIQSTRMSAWKYKKVGESCASQATAM